MSYIDYIETLLKINKEGLLKTNKNKSPEALADILENKISEYDYYGKENLNYLLNIFDILPIIMSGNKDQYNTLYNQFAKMHNMIKNLIHNKPENIKEQDHNYRFLKLLIYKMENCMLSIFYDNPIDYDPSKYEFIYYIVFEQKNYSFFKMACEKFPHIINNSNLKEIPLIEMVIDKYLIALDTYVSRQNLGPLDDLIYYDKIINLMITNEKLKLDSKTLKEQMNKIKIAVNREEFITNRHKEKYSFFINNLLNILTRDEPNQSIEYLSYKYEVHDKFKEAHNLEAKTIYLNNKTFKKTNNGNPIYTFDGENAMEIDDGLSIELHDGIYTLGVHIANPMAVISPQSILFDEAKRRTTSIYLDEFCIPMYPLILSSDIISLNEGKIRPCISYYYKIDEISGELLDFTIKKENRMITGNHTYKKFNEILEHGDNNEQLQEAIINLNKISPILSKIYQEDETYAKVNNQIPNISESNDTGITMSEKTVANAMIYTNYQTAKLFDERELPFIYRCHSVDDKLIQKLNKLQEKLKLADNNNEYIKTIEMMKTIFPKAYYSIDNSGHYGLGIDYYSHVTSPLRRLADNIAIQCIDKFILKKHTKEDEQIMVERIIEAAETINTKRSTTDDYVIQYNLRKNK